MQAVIHNRKGIEPRKTSIFGVGQAFIKTRRQHQMKFLQNLAPPGSEATTCIESQQSNLGELTEIGTSKFDPRARDTEQCLTTKSVATLLPVVRCLYSSWEVG